MPISLIRPFSITTIWSADKIVESRCAIAITVRPRARSLERDLDLLFRFRVESGSRFVEQENRRVLQQRAGDGKALLLSAGEQATLVADDGLVAFRLRHDELVRVSGLGGGINLLRRGIEPAELNVFEDRVVKQERVLRTNPICVAQRLLRQRPQDRGRRSVTTPRLDRKAQNERKDGALARTARADEGVTLPRLDPQVETVMASDPTRRSEI